MCVSEHGLGRCENTKELQAFCSFPRFRPGGASGRRGARRGRKRGGFCSGLERSGDFFRNPGIPRNAPDHYRNHLFSNPPPARRRPRPPGSPPRVEKDVDSVVVWSDPRIPSEFLESHGTPQTTTKTISYSTLRRPGGARGGRGARRGLNMWLSLRIMWGPLRIMWAP